LERAAADLGLDGARLAELERALTAAYETRHRVIVRRDDAALMDMPPASLAPLEPATDPRMVALQRRIAHLQARVKELTHELEEARANVSVEVDFSDVDTAPANESEDLDEIYRRVRHAPREVVSLRALFRAASKAGEIDRAYCAAHALSFL